MNYMLTKLRMNELDKMLQEVWVNSKDHRRHHRTSENVPSASLLNVV